VVGRYELARRKGAKIDNNQTYQEHKLVLRLLERQPCEDCISRQAAIRIASGYCHPANIAAELAKLPPAQPKIKTGHWIEIAQYSDGKHKIECSECGSHIFDRGHANSFNVRNKYKYCPKCGAKMWEGE
jgi:Zn finger protein HypA/HybF involved in hydrogenase expression